MSESKCPMHQTAGTGTSNRDWWPDRLRLNILRQHSSRSDPMGEDFDYAAEFRTLDLAAVKQDLREPLVYTAILALLLAARLVAWLRPEWVSALRGRRSASVSASS